MLIGNDIVALNEKQNLKSFNRPGYLMKFSFPSEQRRCKDLETNSTAFLWSLKESTYKLIQKYLNVNIFNPKDFYLLTCKASSDVITSTIEYTPGNLLLTGNTFTNRDYVHTITLLKQEHLTQCQHKVIRYDASEPQEMISTRLKKALAEHVGSRLNIYDTSQINIVKNRHGIPCISLSKNIIPDISLSHDGEFGAYVYLCAL
ncbi:MAG: 4'-phosphopantetheinyl transferase family protein [Bacteroidales bacterium]